MLELLAGAGQGAALDGRVAVTFKANTVELWEFINQSPLAHPIHLHGEAFRVVERSWDDDGLAAAWCSISHGVIDARILIPGGGLVGVH